MEQNKTNKERGLGQGRGFFQTNLCLDWKKVMGGSWGQGEGRSSLPGTVYRTARERGMTTLVFLDWRH